MLIITVPGRGGGGMSQATGPCTLQEAVAQPAGVRQAVCSAPAAGAAALASRPAAGGLRAPPAAAADRVQGRARQ